MTTEAFGARCACESGDVRQRHGEVRRTDLRQRDRKSERREAFCRLRAKEGWVGVTLFAGVYACCGE
jgi:hypothetical protein